MIFFSIFARIFANQIEAIQQKSYNSGYNQCASDKISESQKSRQLILESKYEIGKLFISICNEWHSMTIVEITGYEKNVPVGIDLLTGKDLLLFSNLLEYSDETIRVLKKLNPYERYALTSNQIHYLNRKEKLPTKHMEFEDEISAEEFIAIAKKHSSLN